MGCIIGMNLIGSVLLDIVPIYTWTDNNNILFLKWADVYNNKMYYVSQSMSHKNNQFN